MEFISSRCKIVKGYHEIDHRKDNRCCAWQFCSLADFSVVLHSIGTTQWGLFDRLCQKFVDNTTIADRLRNQLNSPRQPIWCQLITDLCVQPSHSLQQPINIYHIGRYILKSINKPLYIDHGPIVKQSGEVKKIPYTTIIGYKHKQKYRGMFETQKSGNKTSSGEIGLNIRTLAYMCSINCVSDIRMCKLFSSQVEASSGWRSSNYQSEIGQYNAESV